MNSIVTRSNFDMRALRTLVFGESIAYGAWDSMGGWVDRLKQHEHKKTLESAGSHKSQVFNLGIGGDTSTDILSRIGNELESRWKRDWSLRVIISCGVNDARFIQRKPEVTIQKYESNLRQMIAIVRHYTDDIVFVATPPISRKNVVFKEMEFRDEVIQQYEETMRAVAESEQVSFVTLRQIFAVPDMQSLYSYDGLHPNDNGHKLIYEEVKRILEVMTA